MSCLGTYQPQCTFIATLNLNCCEAFAKLPSQAARILLVTTPRTLSTPSLSETILIIQGQGTSLYLSCVYNGRDPLPKVLQLLEMYFQNTLVLITALSSKFFYFILQLLILGHMLVRWQWRRVKAARSPHHYPGDKTFKCKVSNIMGHTVGPTGIIHTVEPLRKHIPISL